MSEMIERVARVIGELYDGYADPIATPNNWHRAVVAARAAIEAMREPTADMLAAEGVYTNCCTCGGHLEGWHALIDAALSDPA